MSTGTGSTVIDFGAGGNEASVVVSVPEILGTSKAEAWIMGDDTSTDHTASDHKYVGLFMALTCGTPVAATGFTIYARSTQKLTGAWTVRYVWAD